jgi:RNA polymerase sigma-B factor
MVREELVRRHQHLAYALANRFCRHPYDKDDRAQVALLGLLNAVDRYDPDRGVEFSTFAWATIDGELKRLHRSASWTPRVPRALQELHLRTSAAVEHLTAQLGRSPTIEEIASETGDSTEAVVQGIELNHARGWSPLDAPGRHGRSVLDMAAHRDVFAAVDARLAVEHLLTILPVRSREIVRLRFASQMSQSEIAARVGLSQMQVSRLLAQAMTAMREAGEGLVEEEPSGP